MRRYTKIYYVCSSILLQNLNFEEQKKTTFTIGSETSQNKFSIIVSLKQNENIHVFPLSYIYMCLQLGNEDSRVKIRRSVTPPDMSVLHHLVLLRSTR